MTNLIDNYLSRNKTISTQKNFTTKAEIPSATKMPQVDTKVVQSLKDSFESEHKKNGFFEKFYNFLKNKTHFGTGSEKVKQSITEYENHTKTKEEVEKEIKKYRTSQKNSEQAFGDVAAIGTGVATYYTSANLLKKVVGVKNINNAENILEMILGSGYKNNPKPIVQNIEKIVKSFGKKSIAITSAVVALSMTGFVKDILLRINRTPSEEFKTNKDMTKQEKKAIKKAKKKENSKNFWGGTLYGAMTGLFGLVGGVVAAPAILATNLLLRYNRTTPDKKSFNDFVEKYKDNAAMNTAATILMAIPLIKKPSFSKVLEKNLKNTVGKLKDATLTPKYTETKTAYGQLEEMLISSDGINNIYQGNLPIAEKIKALTKENIFATKFMQISDNYGSLSQALREECPSTRTIEEASEFISKTFGKKYQVSKQLGVGTIAETYLAKDTESGKEVCIKILKDGISAEKIEADKNKMIQLIKTQFKDEKEQEYLLRNLDDLANGIKQEVDFTNEMKAAEELAKYTKKATVVKPIEVKENIYVMEKANGISLKTLQDALNIERELKYYRKYNSDWAKEHVAELENKLEKIKAKSPDFDLSGITYEHLQKMLNQYMKVNVEQFNAINKNGKVLHADIHPGNVFIDLEALKTGKGNLLTLIDTGNTVNMSKIQAANSLNLSKYIKQGNVHKLTEYVLDGAILPDGLTKEKAFELVEKELHNCFFDNKTKIGMMTNDSLLELTSNIMREHNILPASTQLNFEKAKKSANKSFMAFIKSFVEKKYGDIDIENKGEVITQLLQLSKDSTAMITKYKIAQKLQEIKNAFQLGLKNMLKKDKNVPKTNSEDYLTYKLKQWKLFDEDQLSEMMSSRFSM